MNVAIVEAEFDHVRALCENMRERERAAFHKLGEEPESAITRELSRAMLAYTGLIDEQVVNMWGVRVAGILSDEAYIWMLCTEFVNKHPMIFLRHSHRALALIRPHFKRLHGLVLADFDCSVKWLTWLGFEVAASQNGIRAFHI